MGEAIPLKGQVLTQMSAWWCRQLEGVVNHHMISADTSEIVRAVPALAAHRDAIDGRATFDKLSYSNRSWHVLQVTGAKTEETRRRRIARSVEALKQGRPR